MLLSEIILIMTFILERTKDRKLYFNNQPHFISIHLKIHDTVGH